MNRIMLVIENSMEQQFLEKFTKRLGFHTVSISKTQVIADQLRDFFPDLVFASMIGRQSQTLQALAKIKASRGIPKVVFVRKENDNSPLSPDQKQIVDGLLYSPIDPFKLIDILSDVMEIPVGELRAKYREVTQVESTESSSSSIETTEDAMEGDADAAEAKPSSTKPSSRGRVFLFDDERKKKYDDIIKNIGKSNDEHPEFDSKKFKQLQKQAADSVTDDPELHIAKQEFIKALFSTPSGS